jgi:glycerophosphoryl diester phosphodiesterase
VVVESVGFVIEGHLRGLDLLRRPGALPKVVGHRGACEVAPENTLASFERAWRDGADIVEMDIRLTADRQPVVFHDAMVDRTTDGAGEVAGMTAAALKQLDAGSWFDARFAGERVPLLREVFDWAKGRLGLLLELKYSPYGSYEPYLVPTVLDAIVDADIAEQVAAISYQPKALRQLKALAPHIPAGPMFSPRAMMRLVLWLARRWSFLTNLEIVRRVLLRPLAFTRSWACDVVAPNIEIVTPLLVERAHAAGMPLSCGGLVWDYPRAIEMGVDTVSANNPGLVRKLYLS